MTVTTRRATCAAMATERTHVRTGLSAHITGRMSGPSPEETVASATARSQIRYAGLPSPAGPRPRCVKQVYERGEASLRTFGSDTWASKATEAAPYHVTTQQLAYGIVAVPSWRHEVEETHRGVHGFNEHPRGPPIWLGTRYARLARPASAPAKPPGQAPWPNQEDPRLAKCRAIAQWY